MLFITVYTAHFRVNIPFRIEDKYKNKRNDLSFVRFGIGSCARARAHSRTRLETIWKFIEHIISIFIHR